MIGACGAAPVAPDLDRRASAVTEPPPTDADPPAWVPPPDEAPTTGRAVAIATSGGYDQARAVAIRFVLAVRDGDEAVLSRLLSERVGHVVPRLTSPNRDRGELVRIIVRNPRRAGLSPDVPLDELVDSARMEVTPLVRNTDTLPPGLSGSDLLVQFPLRAQGRRFRLIISNWSAEGRLVVRPGVEPQILCL
jgi:hypothetical protein